MLKWFRRKPREVSALDYEQMHVRTKQTLKALAAADARLKKMMEEHREQIQKMQEQMDRALEQYDWRLDEAKVTISKYEKQVDSLRDEIRVNEKTIEAMDASIVRFQQHWKTETALEVRREVGAQHNHGEIA